MAFGSVPQAKEVLYQVLPVSEATLRRHQEAVAALHVRHRSKRHAERQQQREMYKMRHEQHASHYVVSNNVLQVGWLAGAASGSFPGGKRRPFARRGKARAWVPGGPKRAIARRV